MSAKRDPDEEDDHDFDGEDDEEDEEDEFEPGEDEDEDEEERSESIFLDGLLSVDTDRKLHFQGDRFHLQSTTAVPWNILDATTAPPLVSFTVEMTGPCHVETSEDEGAVSLKPTPRHLVVTVSVVDSNDHHGTPASAAPRKSTGDDDEPKKRPATAYQIQAAERVSESSTSPRLEFRSVIYPTDTKDGQLSSQWRVEVVHVVPLTAPASAATASTRNDDDDNVQDVVDDQEVDCNELIALQEEAGMSVDALRKRYRSGGSHEPSDSKKPKADYDDDDDVEF